MVVGIWNTSLPIGVPMLKRVAALPGQTVCRDGRMITVDGTDLAETLDRDRRGRPGRAASASAAAKFSS